MNRRRILFLSPLILIWQFAAAQSGHQKEYPDSIKDYQKKYVADHEVVKRKDKKYFRFYAPDASLNVKAFFEKSKDSSTVAIKTTGQKVPVKYFIRYGILKFNINGTTQELTVFQSKDLMKNPVYKEYLFVPFTDSTSGIETYGSGRYIDMQKNDIKGNECTIDFNKAYNPYCSYSTGYNCPVPPKENMLSISIRAGEKIFAKTH